MSLDCYTAVWDDRVGSKPISELYHANYSESYEMNVMHIFELENGKYISVLEVGCSCYESTDAKIDFYPNKEAAYASFLKYRKARSDLSNLEFIEDEYNRVKGSGDII